MPSCQNRTVLNRGGATTGSRAGLGARWLTACLLLLLAASPAASGTPTLPSGFQDTVAFSGIDEPTAVRFAADGRVFVAEKKGKVLVYSGLGDSTPAEFVDLRAKVYASGDRGLLGLALDPEFPTRPYVYVLYTYDHQLGEAGEGPRWGDKCPSPPGASTDGCVVSGRLSRLTADGDQAVGLEKVLVEGWCQQFTSHSVGDLQFDSNGALYASGGDGASFDAADYGQFGYPQKNPCGDAPVPVGGLQEPPAAEGGAFRSQDARTPYDPLASQPDPTGLNGAVIRIDPDSGEGLAGNPMYGSLDPNERRIVGYGFRNPFRFALKPETNEVYVGNVGAEAYEEIDRFNPTSGSAYNSGWPCIEGPELNPLYRDLPSSVCNSLYANHDSSAQAFFYYDHYAGVVPDDPCEASNGNALTGMTFYDGGAFPTGYDGALFFADSVRGCVYVMYPGEDGRPDPGEVDPFLSDAGLYPGIDLEVGPGGDLFYTSLYGPGFSAGSVHRVAYSSGNQPPVARLAVDKKWGSASPANPLQVNFDAGASSDAEGGPLSFAWDLDGDGVFEASPSATASRSFLDSKNHPAAVRVTDADGATSTDRITIYPGDTPPQPKIAHPDTSFKWSVGELVEFQGGAADEQDGPLSSTSLDWSTRLFHCPGSGCHAHPLEAFPALAAGSFPAPDHEFPSYIELTLTATDERGLSAATTVRIDPAPVPLTIATLPAGLTLSAAAKTAAAPFGLTVIEGSSVVLAAPASQELGGRTYTWAGWSDGGARIHTVLAETAETLTATYSTPADPDPIPEDPDPTPEDPPPSPLPKPAVPATPATPRGSPPSPVSPPPPDTVLGDHPGKSTRSGAAHFTFSATESGVTFRCRLDARPARPCHSPRRYRALVTGRHVFRVVAVNGSGAADPTPAIFRWKIEP
jgi:glucose/arabinose dehydrogenase